MNRLIAFLGNPGREFAQTRHNYGQMLIEHLSDLTSLSWQDKFKGRYIKNGSNIYLVPETFMNKSGESIQPAAAFFKIPVENILVAYDDLELPFGSIGIRQGGGLAGHNGLRSIAERLGSNRFGRLRLGIGRPSRGSVSSFVTSRFNTDEEPFLSDILAEAAELLKSVEGIKIKEKKIKVFEAL